jgi:hypothetical protein
LNNYKKGINLNLVKGYLLELFLFVNPWSTCLG